MNKRWMVKQIILTAFVFTGIFLYGSSFAANTRVTNPSAFSLDVGGRGMLYSFNFDRVLNENLVVGLGIGSVPLNNPDRSSANMSATLIPTYLNYYFFDDASSLFLTAGGDMVVNASSVNNLNSAAGNLQFSSSPFLLTFGLGYEYRSDAGFLVRLTGYGIYGKNLSPWVGFGLGYSF